MQHIYDAQDKTRSMKNYATTDYLRFTLIISTGQSCFVLTIIMSPMGRMFPGFGLFIHIQCWLIPKTGTPRLTLLEYLFDTVFTVKEGTELGKNSTYIFKTVHCSITLSF